jgi:hypothetical protein
MKDMYGDFTQPGEIICVGAGLGGGFVNTNELHIIKYGRAMASDKKGWTAAVKEEHERMLTHSVFLGTPKARYQKAPKSCPRREHARRSQTGLTGQEFMLADMNKSMGSIMTKTPRHHLW